MVMASLQQRNYRFAGAGFLFAAAIFFATQNTAMGATFLALGVVFIVLSGKSGKQDGE
tara:strand:+ start:28337 stop:28510 length:174 start_codon:yes stop_codon:yes gene_type:complete